MSSGGMSQWIGPAIGLGAAAAAPFTGGASLMALPALSGAAAGGLGAAGASGAASALGAAGTGGAMDAMGMLPFAGTGGAGAGLGDIAGGAAAGGLSAFGKSAPTMMDLLMQQKQPPPALPQAPMLSRAPGPAITPIISRPVGITGALSGTNGLNMNPQMLALLQKLASGSGMA